MLRRHLHTALSGHSEHFALQYVRLCVAESTTGQKQLTTFGGGLMQCVWRGDGPRGSLSDQTRPKQTTQTPDAAPHVTSAQCGELDTTAPMHRSELDDRAPAASTLSAAM
jgi:hypothetical protein